MFEWKVKEVAERKGIRSAVQLAELVDIANGTATSLWYARPTRFDLPILDRLCDVLDCEPWEILVYTRNTKPDPDKAEA